MPRFEENPQNDSEMGNWYTYVFLQIVSIQGETQTHLVVWRGIFPAFI